MFLINWLLHNCVLGVFSKYPIKILPKTNYVCPIDLVSIQQEGLKIALTRRSNNGASDTFEKIQGIRADALFRESDSVLDYREALTFSMNLMGGVFDKSHCCFVQKNPATKNWDGEEKISFWEHRKNYQIEHGASVIYFPIEELQCDIPFVIKDKTVAKQYKLVDFQQETQVEHGACISVEHSPNKLNYWHSSLKTTSKKGEEEATIKGGKSQYKKEIAQFIALDILVEAGVASLHFDDIPKKYYDKRAS